MELFSGLFFLLTTIHLMSTGWLALPLLFHRTKKRNESAKSLSVIVAARNEAKNLPHLIAAMATQNHPDFEVIVANDRSQDDSQRILEDLQKEHDFLRVLSIHELPEPWTGKKYALKRAIETAKNDFLVFTDADCCPKTDQWLERLSAVADDQTDVVLGFSPYEKRKGFLNQFIQWETLVTALQYLGLGLLNNAYMGVGRNMMIRKSAYDLDYLEKIKHLNGGDDDLMIAHLSNSSNTKVVFDPASQVLSEPKLDINSYIKQKTRHLSAGQYYDHKVQTLLGVFTLSWLVTWGMLIVSLVIPINQSVVLSAFAIRSLLFYIVMYQLGLKLNTYFKIWALPFLDLCYCLYYPIVAVKTLATKKVEWK